MDNGCSRRVMSAQGVNNLQSVQDELDIQSPHILHAAISCKSHRTVSP